MIKRNETNNSVTNRKNRNNHVSSLLVVVCGAVIVSGFFIAAGQHFSSMDYGMKNSRLRKQIDQLQAEKQRLIHEREVSLSPGGVKRAAKKAGLLDAPATSSNVYASADPVEMKAARRSADQPLVQKISAVEPVRKTRATEPKVTSSQPKRTVAMR